MEQWPFFPRSLRQLVMMAFLLVLVPLLVLAWQAWQSLNILSEQAEQTNHSTLVDARRSEAMTNLALEMERSYRQYCVLDDPRLVGVYQAQRQHYQQMLNAQASTISDPQRYQVLEQMLGDLATVQCQNSAPSPEVARQLETFATSNAALQQMTRTIMFSRGQQLQQAIAEKGRFFGWQALVLFLLSVALVLVFTRMIIGPVKTIERMIARLGKGRTLKDNAVVRGPRELQAVGQRVIWLGERLRWSEAQRHEFLRHISHELKTPLASMREGTELLADQVAGPLTDDQREVVAILDQSSRHLQRLIEQLLDYNRRLTDDTPVSEKVVLEPLFRQVIAAHQLSARAKKMVTHCTLSVARCCGDAALLMTVLDNLYSNAVHYGEEFATLYLRSTRSGDSVCIDVANTGNPIPFSEREMIFEPFYQGSQQRKGAVKGTGLGLSIARDCMQRMGGEMMLVEDPDAAVCFRLVLPMFCKADEKE